jgi:hypothetical protein
MDIKYKERIENAVKLREGTLEDFVLVLTRHHSEEVDGFLDFYGDVPSNDKIYLLHLPQFFKSVTYEDLLKVKPSPKSNDNYDHRSFNWGSGSCELSPFRLDVVVGKGEYIMDNVAVFSGKSFKSREDVERFIRNNLSRNY